MKIADTQQGRKVRCPLCQSVFRAEGEIATLAFPVRGKRTASSKKRGRDFSSQRVIIVVACLVGIGVIGSLAYFVFREVQGRQQYLARKAEQERLAQQAIDQRKAQEFADLRTWKTHRDPTGRFQLDYRGQVRQTQSSMAKSKVTTWLHAAEDVDTKDVFVASFSAPPAGWKPIPIEARFDGGIAAATKKPGAKLLYRRNVKIAELPGCEFRVDEADGLITVTRSIFIEDDSITLMFGTRDASRIESVGMRFLNSLQLLDSDGQPVPHGKAAKEPHPVDVGPQP